MARRPAEPHSQHFNLREALEQPGCAICTVVTKALARELDSLLYERVNDPGMRQELRASAGFCHRHAWELCDVGDGMGVGMLYQALLERAIASLDQLRGGRGAAGLYTHPTAQPCPSCRQAAETGQRYLRVFVESFEDATFRSALDRSQGLCLAHVQDALALCRGPRQRTTLIAWESAKLSTVLRQLTEFLRKHDYRFAVEGYRTEEAASWLRVVELFVGQRGKKP